MRNLLIGGIVFLAFSVLWGASARSMMRLFPELSLIEPERERKAVWESAQASASVTWYVLLLTTVLLSIKMQELAMLYLGRYVPTAYREVLDIAAKACVSVCVFCAGVWTRRRRIAKAIRLEVNRRGIPICMGCGYCLRGISSLRCPECGAAYDPHACPTCSGRGFLSRRNLFTNGLILAALGGAFAGGLGVALSTDPPRMSFPEAFILFLMFPLPLLGVGIGILYWCARRGGQRRCTDCGGSAKRARQAE